MSFFSRYADKAWFLLATALILFGSIALLSSISTVFTHWILTRSQRSVIGAEVGRSPLVRLTVTLSLTDITTQSNLDENLTEVDVRVNHPSLREIELHLPVSDPAHLQQDLATELNIPITSLPALQGDR